MKITIDTKKGYVLIEDKGLTTNFSTKNPAEILRVVIDELVPYPFPCRSSSTLENMLNYNEAPEPIWCSEAKAN